MGNVDFVEWEQKMKKGGVRQGTVRTGRNPQGICRSRGDREKKSAPQKEGAWTGGNSLRTGTELEVGNEDGVQT